MLCVDEKSQIQALDRTQPILPMKPGTAQRMTHDYKRNGTTTLFAALEIATGVVTGRAIPSTRHQEFLAFLNQLVKACPRRRFHVVLDNSATHSTPDVNRWLRPQARPLPLHPDQRLVAEPGRDLVPILTKQQVRRGAFHDVPELIAAIEHYIDGYNDGAQPFVWTKTADRSSRRPSNDNPLQERCTSVRPAPPPTPLRAPGRRACPAAVARRRGGPRSRSCARRSRPW